MVVEVVGGWASSVRYEDTGEAAPRGVFLRYDTVDKLFDLLRFAIILQADSLDVVYDPVLGYPQHADIDYILNAADDELSFAVSGLGELVAL